MMENWEQYKDLEYYPDRVCKCGCGSRIKVQPWHKWRDSPPRYIPSHNRRGIAPWNKNLTKEVAPQLAKSEEVRKKIGGSRGKYSEEYGRACSVRAMKLWEDPSYREKQREAKKRVKHGPHSEEAKRKMRGERIPREIRICGCGCEGTFECKINSKQRFIRYHACGHHWKPDKEFIEKRRIAQKKLWADPKYKEKQLKAIFEGLKLLPNKPEKFLLNLLQELFSNQWKYVGDGKFWIGARNPDFINVNGRKKIIEHFGDYHHGEGATGASNDQHEQERINHFAKYGYQTLIIWQHELKDLDSLIEKIVNFSEVQEK